MWSLSELFLRAIFVHSRGLNTNEITVRKRSLNNHFVCIKMCQVTGALVTFTMNTFYNGHFFYNWMKHYYFYNGILFVEANHEYGITFIRNGKKTVYTI